MKLKFLLIVSLFLSFGMNASASEIYYTNDDDVSFSVEEYNFISKMFYDGFQDYMNQNDFNFIFDDESILNSEISSNYDNSISLYSTEHSTSSKIIKISSTCTSTCLITVVVNWYTIPTIKSYDVMGAYLDGVSLVGDVNTKVELTSAYSTYTDCDEQTNGFGVSFQLPSTINSSLTIIQYYRVSGSGMVYASYQHAKKTISLTNSKKYTISRDGYGGVFLFNSTYQSYYDGMGGVSISV